MAFFNRKRDPDEILGQALEQMNAGRSENALKCIDEVLTLDPEHAQAWYFKGCHFSSLGDYQAAIPCFAASAKYAGERAHLPLYNMGNAYQELEQFDKALECFTLAVQAAPEMADAWINRGRLLDDSGRHADAIECYDIALEVEPSDVVAWSNRGNSLRALGRWTEAIASYEKALELDEHDPAALLGTGICLGRTGDAQRGLEFLDRGLALVEHPASLGERATLLSMLERHEEALACLDQAIAAGAATPQAWNNRGEVLATLKNVDGALNSFDEALRLDANFAPAWFGKARALYNNGRTPEARQCIEKYFATRSGGDDLDEAARALVVLCERAAE